MGDLRAKLVRNRPHVLAAFDAYNEKSETKSWCRLIKMARGNPDAIAVGDLSKGELVDLYNNNVVRSSGRARQIYDQIKVAACQECPYCGGMGEMGETSEIATADHYLPKARFPVYSVFPLNLVPSCRTCNDGMNDNFPTEERHQPIHPYLDDIKFFTERWVYASVREEDPIIIDFTVDPPVAWPEVDRSRVNQHFKDLKLPSRYRARVWQELAPLIAQRKNSIKGLNFEEFRNHLRSVADLDGLPVNGFKRTLYSGLASSEWFCGYDFNTVGD